MSALFVQQLTVIDFSFLHAQRGLLGESWIVDLELHGDLDDQGMVFDFGPVKKLAKQAIDSVADHKLLIPTQLPGLKVDHLDNEELEIGWQTDDYYFHHKSPPEAVKLLDCQEITPASLTQTLVETIAKIVPSNVTNIKVNLSPEPTDGAFYHYSHGLKKHLGDCQRIAHGHRSKLQVLRDGERALDIEQRWCEKFKDIYLATTEDLVAETTQGEISCYQFTYESEQGQFSIELPQGNCILLETDTTVELIAQYLADSIRSENPDAKRLEVRAFEGVGKGAIAIV